MPLQAWTGQARIKGTTKAQRMMMLTFSLIGLQFTWGVEMTYFTPYLLQLGLVKSQTSLVWTAPPISGLIVQPIIGTLSDSSKSGWGRRRPYMLVSAILVALFLLTLGWASETVGIFVKDEGQAKKATVALAIFCIYAIDFAINAGTHVSSHLVAAVDTLSISDQHIGSAWASRMLGLGHLLGYAVGTMDLSLVLGHTLGGTQFKQLCIIASLSILFCVGVTCYCVEERVLLSMSLTGTDSGVWMVIPKIVDTALHLPSTIRAVCWITFWQWIGWAPFFFYGTTWVGETYYRQDPRHAEELKTSKDVLGDIARRGSLALVLFSLISFVGSIVLPFIVNSSESEERGPSTTRVSKPMARMINRIRSLQPDITTAWALSMLAFSTSMFLAPISRSFTFATSLVAVCGIPWAMTGWAPLAIMGVEINRLGSLTPNTNSSHRTGTYTTLLQTEGSFELTRLSHDSPPHQSAATTDLLTAEIEAQAQQDADEDVEQAEQDQPTSEVSGIYLGILNIFATIPQLLGTFISAIVFSILEPGQSPELSGGASPEGGDEADTGGEVVGVRLNGLSGTAVCLAIGAICSFVAAVQTFRLGRM